MRQSGTKGVRWGNTNTKKKTKTKTETRTKTKTKTQTKTKTKIKIKTKTKCFKGPGMPYFIQKKGVSRISRYFHIKKLFIKNVHPRFR